MNSLVHFPQYPSPPSSLLALLSEHAWLPSSSYYNMNPSFAVCIAERLFILLKEHPRVIQRL
ncbi:unnamed protein product [Moneuplotes crassus]|uniref:Uncharacterized protein n=1 Tax=Euplotes crassus TaxID=5936 RepID=A0AAD1UH99_EUPCR|nr:unnamed protein product [Moneuplotes crassus]